MNAPTRPVAGKDPRIVSFRGALTSLIESLVATARIARWETTAGPIPEPLRHSAALLQDRLGSANRLAAGTFVGTQTIVATSEAIKEAVRTLDAAFVAYRRRAERTAWGEAASGLDAEVERIKIYAHRWE